MAEAKKTTVEIASGEKKDKKDGSGSYYIYKDTQGVQLLSNDELKEGLQDVYMTEKESEYNGKKSITRWVTKDAPQAKGGGKFFPKTPDKVAILKEAGAIVDALIAMGIEVKAKTREELWVRIDRELVEVNRRVK